MPYTALIDGGLVVLAMLGCLVWHYRLTRNCHYTNILSTSNIQIPFHITIYNTLHSRSRDIDWSWSTPMQRLSIGWYLTFPHPENRCEWISRIGDQLVCAVAASASGRYQTWMYSGDSWSLGCALRYVKASSMFQPQSPSASWQSSTVPKPRLTNCFTFICFVASMTSHPLLVSA